MGEGQGSHLGPHLAGKMFCLLKALDPKEGLFCLVLPNAKPGVCLMCMPPSPTPHIIGAKVQDTSSLMLGEGLSNCYTLKLLSPEMVQFTSPIQTPLLDILFEFMTVKVSDTA